MCGLHRVGDRCGGGPSGQIVSIKKAANGSRHKSWKIIDEEREREVQGQERILVEHLNGLEKNDFGDFDKPRKRAYQKGKIEFNEQRREASRNEFVEKGGMPDRVKSFKKIDSRKNC